MINIGRTASPQTTSSLTNSPSTASPPSPLRMERGVNTIVCKWRGRFFDARRGSSRHKETPFSNREGRFFNSRILSPLFLFSITLQANSSLHAPLHSERGRGWGCRWTVVWLVVGGSLAFCCLDFGYVFYVKDGDIQIFFLPLQHITIDGLFSKPQ